MVKARFEGSIFELALNLVVILVDAGDFTVPHLTGDASNRWSIRSWQFCLIFSLGKRLIFILSNTINAFPVSELDTCSLLVGLVKASFFEVWDVSKE